MNGRHVLFALCVLRVLCGRKESVVLAVRDVHTFYGSSHVLQGVSLDVSPGQAVALLGRNGVGKTTTLHSIVGFLTPRAGKITFMGQDVIGTPSYRTARLGLGFVPQGRRIFPNLTVRENITLAARRGQAPASAWTLDRIYDTFPRLKERAANWGNQLSGGEQQLLAIARALATNPSMLLLDEPSEGLAPLIVAEIGRIIVRLKQEGLAILLVEQNFPMAMAVADSVSVMNKGQIVFTGPPEALAADQELKHKYLGV
jgi:branched-chain amino acid transport system ATP-binding protein